MALVKTVTMRVLADAGRAQAVLDELTAKADKLGAKDVSMRFRVSGGAEGAAELAAISRLADRLHLKDVTVKVRVDGAGRAIAELKAVRDAGGGGILNRLIGGTGAGIPESAGPVPLALLPAVVAGAGALLPELTGLVSGFAAAAAGAGAFYLLAHPAINNLQQDVQGLDAANQKLGIAQQKYLIDPTKAHAKALHEAQVAYQATYRQMGQDAGSAAGQVLKLHDAYVKVTTAFQPQAFRVLGDMAKVLTNALPALTPMANAFAGALDPLLKRLASFTASKGFGDFIKQFSSLTGPAVTAIGDGVGKVAQSIGKLLTTMNAADVSKSIGIAFNTIAGAISGVASVVSRLMSNWDQMSSAAKSATHAVASAFDSMRSGVATSVAGVESTMHSVASAFDAFRHGAATAADAVVAVFKALPGKVLAALGNLGSLLAGAGRAIIQGLISGIESALGALWGLIGSIGGKIASLKGPVTADRLLLVPHGQAIMGGLIAGINSQLPVLEGAALKIARVLSAKLKTELAFAKSVTQAAISGLGLTSIDLSQGTVLSGMASYLDSIRAFTAQLKALSAQGLNKDLLKQLIAAGPVAGGPYAASILASGAGPVNALWKQIQQASGALGTQAGKSVYGDMGTLNVTVTVRVAPGSSQAFALEVIQVIKEFKRHGGGAALGIA